MSNNHETLKKEMEQYLDQFENLMDVPMATLTAEQRDVLTEIAKERYAGFSMPNGYSIPPNIPVVKLTYNPDETDIDELDLFDMLDEEEE